MTPSGPFSSVILRQREDNPSMEEGGGLAVIDKDQRLVTDTSGGVCDHIWEHEKSKA